MNEHLGSPVPAGAAQRNALRRVLFHPVKRTVFDDRIPTGLVDRNVEKTGDAAHFGRRVMLQVVEMHEQAIGQVPVLPPGAHIFPERPERMTVPVHPVAPIVADVGGRRRDRRADPARRIIEQVVPELIGIRMVIVHTPDHIPAVARDIDVFRFGRINQRIERQMRLDESAVRLRREHGQFDVLGRYAQVQPGRHLRDLQTRIAVENQLCDDLLHPGRAGFCIGRDDDVVVPKGKIVPDRRIEMMIMQFSDFDRP